MKLLELLNTLQELNANSRSVGAHIKERLSAEHIATIEERQRRAIAKAQTVLDTLQNQYKDLGVLYFKQVLALYVPHLPHETVPIIAESYTEQGDYATCYNHELYQILLPLSMFIHLEEKNGSAQQHAFHLSLIFNGQRTVLTYLKGFAKGTKSNAPLHDACLFDLPSPLSCDFPRWKKWANQLSSTGELMMLSPYFREILPHASALELMEQKGRARILEKAAIGAKENEVIAVTKAFKTLLQTPRSKPNEAQKEQRKTELSVLSQKLLNLKLELSTLSQGMPLEQASIPMLQAFYAAYQEQQAMEPYKILAQYGLSDRAKRLFSTLKPVNNDDYIPDVFIEGRILGYPGFYLKKLDVLHPKGASIAACLGKITSCCQHLDGQGAVCAVHGINSPYGGFYVVCRGDEANPEMDDPIIAQSWVWYSTTDVLCLDSVETARGESKDNIIIDLYRYLALKLCEQPNLTYVNIGDSSGISQKVGARDYPTPNLNPADYHDYRDSKSQLLLAHKNIPYLFYGRTLSDAIQSIISSRTAFYFEYIFSFDGSLKDNQQLNQVISFLIHTRQDNEQHSLFRLLITHSGAKATELQELIVINQLYIRQLENNSINFNALTQGASVHSVSSKGMNALHIAVMNDDIDAVNQLLALKINLNIQNKEGDTALHQTLKHLLNGNREAQAIFETLIENKADLDIKNASGQTALIWVSRLNQLDRVRYLVEHHASLES